MWIVTVSGQNNKSESVLVNIVKISFKASLNCIYYHFYNDFSKKLHL